MKKKIEVLVGRPVYGETVIRATDHETSKLETFKVGRPKKVAFDTLYPIDGYTSLEFWYSKNLLEEEIVNELERLAETVGEELKGRSPFLGVGFKLPENIVPYHIKIPRLYETTIKRRVEQF